MTSNRFLAKLKEGPVICGEGYVFELERRGYLQAGAFVPEVVLEFPEAVTQLHREFVRCGSDVVEALTYYAHREKLRVIGKEHLLEEMNHKALELAKQVAKETNTLVAGNICNTNIYDPKNPETTETVRQMFREQIKWAKDAGVDYIVAETIYYLGEAEIALEEIKRVELPAVITFAIRKEGDLWDGTSPVDASIKMEEGGAAVVGLNCARGPETMLPILKDICSAVKIPVAALPVPYRTSPNHPTFQSLRDPHCLCHLPSDVIFPTALDPFTCNRYEISDFTKKAQALGVKYFGLCCGAGPHHLRSMAEALGRETPASRFSPDMAKHFLFGNNEKAKKIEEMKATV